MRKIIYQMRFRKCKIYFVYSRPGLSCKQIAVVGVWDGVLSQEMAKFVTVWTRVSLNYKSLAFLLLLFCGKK